MIGKTITPNIKYAKDMKIAFISDNGLQYHELKYFSSLQKYVPEGVIWQWFVANLGVFQSDSKYIRAGLKKIDWPKQCFQMKVQI